MEYKKNGNMIKVIIINRAKKVIYVSEPFPPDNST